MSRVARLLPILHWGSRYERRDARSDIAAGLTVGAMLVPQAMAYALLAGLPPEVGLYAATVPVVIYALFGTSRQLAVGPVAIVSLMTASALAPLVEEGTAGYVGAAALLALMVGVIHIVLGVGRLGFLINFLSHSVLVGFTAAAALIIGFSQVKHLLGVSTERQDHFYATVLEVAAKIPEANGPTLVLGGAAITALFALKRWAKQVPAALVVVVGSIFAVEAFDLRSHGVSVVGDIPDMLPAFGVPDFDGSLIRSLLGAAFVITIVGFMESVAVAKIYARRHRYELVADNELVGLGAANVAAGLFGGYPVTGGFSRTAVNDSAGARTPLASIITAAIVLLTIAFLTPLFSSLPNAALGAIIVMAVTSLIDIDEMRHIAAIKPSDLIGLVVAFVATLVLGIELGIAVAVIASLLVVFARSARASHRGRAQTAVAAPATVEGVTILQITGVLSFLNAAKVKKRILVAARSIDSAAAPPSLVVDVAGVIDLDAAGAEMVFGTVVELSDLGVDLHLANVNDSVSETLRRAGITDQMQGRIHASVDDALQVCAEAPNHESDDSHLKAV